MAVALNHTIVHARDKRASAQFYAEVFGLAYWADPGGHLLEIITRPYGSELPGQ